MVESKAGTKVALKADSMAGWSGLPAVDLLATTTVALRVAHLAVSWGASRAAAKAGMMAALMAFLWAYLKAAMTAESLVDETVLRSAVWKDMK